MLKYFLTIVIPCKNEEAYIGNLLDDLHHQIGIDGVRIIIADANSSDNTRLIASTYKSVLNVEIVDGGPVSYGRNVGAALATTEYILFIDADVRLFNEYTLVESYITSIVNNLDLLTLKMKNYGTDWRASLLFMGFNLINKIMSRTTPFAIGAYFWTRRDKFNELGGFPDKYETSEDYILSKQYDSKKFMIGSDYFGQDERRFKKLGYLGMLKYMFNNFKNRHNLSHFEKAKVNYWG